MIVITIDGVNWEVASKMLHDLFPKQTMKMIKCNVREYSDTPEKGQPTVLGLACLWSGKRIKFFHSNIFNRVNPVNKNQEEDNYAIKYIDANEEPLDLVFNHFGRCKTFISGHGPNPHCNMQEYFKFFSEIPNCKELPCEEMSLLYEVAKKDWDLFWIHTSICKTANPWPGPYEQGRVPSLIPYDIIRKDKQLKRKVFEFGIMRMKYIIRCIQEMCPGETIVTSSDHGSNLDIQFKPESIDEIFVIINREIDLAKYEFQWDIKNLLLEVRNENESIRDRTW